jgi:hypothetical protein
MFKRFIINCKPTTTVADKEVKRDVNEERETESGMGGELRREGESGDHQIEGREGDGERTEKKKLKRVKSSIKKWLGFRRVSQAMGKSSDTDKKAGKLFGRKLEELFNPLQDVVNMSQPIKEMLSELEEKGPNTLGIFRRGPNVRAMREVREQLDEFDPLAAPVDGESGVDIGNSCKQVDWSTISVFVTAALLKDFLRSLPDCLLQSDNYNSWIQANNNSDIKALNSCIKSLPEVNQYMLHHLLYLLYKISQNSQDNMMTSSNLSICVGPSILWTQDPQYSLDPAYTKEVSSLLETLIDNYCTLMITRAYDHSSLDSLLNPGGRDDDLNRQNGLEGVSLTNLSQDSGLTTSDSQVYNHNKIKKTFKRILQSSNFQSCFPYLFYHGQFVL